MKYYTKNIFICILLVFALALSASAATLSEMRENGEVSDGGIVHHSPRDGEVSDVTGTGDGLIPEISSAIDEGLGIGSTDMSSDIGSPMGDMGSAPETTGVTNNTASNTAANNNSAAGEKGGMSAGLIIAILVVVAVVVIIFILLPKRK